MLAMGGGEAALLVVAVAIIGWARRRVILELVKPLRLGPFLIRIRPEPPGKVLPAEFVVDTFEARVGRSQPIVCRCAARLGGRASRQCSSSLRPLATANFAAGVGLGRRLRRGHSP